MLYKSGSGSGKYRNIIRSLWGVVVSCYVAGAGVRWMKPAAIIVSRVILIWFTIVVSPRWNGCLIGSVRLGHSNFSPYSISVSLTLHAASSHFSITHLWRPDTSSPGTAWRSSSLATTRRAVTLLLRFRSLRMWIHGFVGSCRNAWPTIWCCRSEINHRCLSCGRLKGARTSLSLSIGISWVCSVQKMVWFRRLRVGCHWWKICSISTGSFARILIPAIVPGGWPEDCLHLTHANCPSSSPDPPRLPTKLRPYPRHSCSHRSVITHHSYHEFRIPSWHYVRNISDRRCQDRTSSSSRNSGNLLHSWLCGQS